MYADRISVGTKRSIKDRLNGNSDRDFVRNLQITGKRQRQNDGKWIHDLYDDEEDPRVSNPKVGSNDLRLKLQRKGSQPAFQSGSSITGVRDLREKLAGTMHPQPTSTDAPKAKAQTEASKPVGKTLHSFEPTVNTKKEATNSTPKKKTQVVPKKDDSVDGLLQSLGLEKYSITFKAEEIDMTALLHMTDGDLKALGIPMGPRKKILLALDSRA